MPEKPTDQASVQTVTNQTCNCKLVRKPDMFHWRGRNFSGLVCVKHNALYDDPADSFLAAVRSVADSRPYRMQEALTEFRDSPSWSDYIRTSAANALMSYPGEEKEDEWSPRGQLGRMEATLVAIRDSPTATFPAIKIAKAGLSHAFEGNDKRQSCLICGELLNDMIHTISNRVAP